MSPCLNSLQLPPMTNGQAEIRMQYPIVEVFEKPRPRLVKVRGTWQCDGRGFAPSPAESYAMWRRSILIDARTFNLQFEPALT